MTSVRGSARLAEALPAAVGGKPVAGPFELLPAGRSMNLQPGCHAVVTPDGFYALEEIWRELSASSRSPSAFQSWDFAVEWLNRFVMARAGGATGRFTVVVAVDGRAGVIGLTPLFEEHSLGQSNLGMTLQPFGRSHSMETLTDEPIALLRQGYEHLATRMLASRIAADARRKEWDIAVVHGARGREIATRTSISLSQRLDNVEVTRRRELPMTLPLAESWPSFESGLSKSMRDNISYYPRRLTREIGPWKIQTARSPSEVAVGTEHLIMLHRRRSQSKAGPVHRNHLPGETEASFLRALFQRLARRDQISLVSLKVAGDTVAVQAFVEAERCLSVYYSGYDERWGRYSPLTIITAEVIREAIARGFDRLEFPPGESAWKSRWGALSSETVEEKSIYPLRLSALFRGLVRRLNQRKLGRADDPSVE
jgi:CelD/BcsL family acetyltransferase involved in cellulose biosynthesis